MQTFLGKLSEQIVQRFGHDLSGVTIVFPTRRAGLFFRSELSRRLDHPIWSPRVIAIQDFMIELADRSLPDQVTQLFELFDVYSEYFPEDSFDHYYPWGEVMLKDFEELDKSLADPGKVFAVIADIKEIDAAFGLSEEDLDRLKAFWGRFFDHGQTRLKDSFAGTWRHLQPIYDRFHHKLEQKGWCTEGKAFRIVSEKVLADPSVCEKTGKHIVFAGLYALSKSEELVISHLIDHGRASIYWDADRHLIDDENQEAGLFLRRSRLFDKKTSLWTEDLLKGASKSIEVIGIPMEVGQAKVAGQLVHELSKQMDFHPERTAVVLPDEHLLFPVLYALPDSLGKINVTMGYPLHQTPIYYLFESMIGLQRNIRGGGDPSTTSYYFKDIQSLIDHPYIRMVAPKEIRSFSSLLIRDKSIRVRQSVIDKLKVPFLGVLFRPVHDSKGLFSWCREVLGHLITIMDQNGFQENRLESEFISRFYTQLTRLEAIYDSVEVESGLETWWGLLRQIIQSTKIPFAGEPLEGLQVMGFLESRVLDFENVILLSVNEDILPASGQHPSFIPFGIRKAFGLPTHEDQHAVTAYHFYRLLQRARNIWLLHNTESKSMTSGEPSRFIVQLEEEVVKKAPEKVSWQKKIISTPVIEDSVSSVSIVKTPEVMASLERLYYDTSVPIAESRSFSATGLLSYISCPLRFYFSHVAGISEPQEKREDLEKNLLGNVLHRAMEYLYKGRKRIDPHDLRQLESAVDECLEKALEKEFIPVAELEGKNRLFKNIIRELMVRVIRIDCKDAPIELVALEDKVHMPFALDEGRTVVLKGVIDRVDGWKDGLRILDYKTGKVEFKKPESLERLFGDSSNKEQFQTMYYAMLTRFKHGVSPIRIGLFTLKQMNEGIKYMYGGESVPDNDFMEFQELLRELLIEIFNPEIPFSQTEDEKNCKYCPFKEICGKE